jgi:NADP-dependent 3-hydroxy acid dehydrogenase YdfG
MAIKNKFNSNHIKVALTDIIIPTGITSPFLECDIRDAKQIEYLYQWVNNIIGVPDILVLNAGVGIKEKLYEGDPEKWQTVFDTNVMGTLRCIRAFVPGMLERKSGHIVFVSSVSANQPHIYGGIYCASKTAIDIIAETLRLETLPYLSVTTISPGATDTDFFENQIAGASDEYKTCDLIDPTEIAEDVYYAINNNQSRSINKIITRPLIQKF